MADSGISSVEPSGSTMTELNN